MSLSPTYSHVTSRDTMASSQIDLTMTSDIELNSGFDNAALEDPPEVEVHPSSPKKAVVQFTLDEKEHPSLAEDKGKHKGSG